MDGIKNFRIRVTNTEFEVIKEVSSSITDLYVSEKFNEFEYILYFSDIDKVDELDELIKEQLVYKGFDINYNPNMFGMNCEKLIDKFYKILK